MSSVEPEPLSFDHPTHGHAAAAMYAALHTGIDVTADVAPVAEPALKVAKKAPATKAPRKTKPAPKKPASKPEPKPAPKLFAAPKNEDDAASIPGVRWAAVVRATGALTASVNAAEYVLVGAADKWMSFCFTHNASDFHPTHRDAWTARRRPQDWCSDCAAIAKDGR